MDIHEEIKARLENSIKEDTSEEEEEIDEVHEKNVAREAKELLQEMAEEKAKEEQELNQRIDKWLEKKKKPEEKETKDIFDHTKDFVSEEQKEEQSSGDNIYHIWSEAGPYQGSFFANSKQNALEKLGIMVNGDPNSVGGVNDWVIEEDDPSKHLPGDSNQWSPSGNPAVVQDPNSPGGSELSLQQARLILGFEKEEPKEEQRVDRDELFRVLEELERLMGSERLLRDIAKAIGNRELREALVFIGRQIGSDRVLDLIRSLREKEEASNQDTLPCPECETKVPIQTSYCVKCDQEVELEEE